MRLKRILVFVDSVESSEEQGERHSDNMGVSLHFVLYNVSKSPFYYYMFRANSYTFNGFCSNGIRESSAISWSSVCGRSTLSNMRLGFRIKMCKIVEI